MKTCEECGIEFKPFEGWESLPSSIRKNIPELIPGCECSIKKAVKEAEMKLLEESKNNAIKIVSKYKGVSVADKKFYESKFESSEMDSKHMRLSKQYASSFLTKKDLVGLMLTGTVGNGKTHAAACIANELMENRKTVLTLSLAGYLSKLREDFAEAEPEMLKRVKKVDLLIIDDFGTEKVTEWVLEKVFSLIDTRYRACKPLLMTTNLDMEDIELRFDMRISDRIKEMCFIHQVTEASRRGKETNDKFKKFLSA